MEWHQLNLEVPPASATWWLCGQPWGFGEAKLSLSLSERFGVVLILPSPCPREWHCREPQWEDVPSGNMPRSLRKDRQELFGREAAFF